MSWSVFLLDETLPLDAAAIGRLVHRVVGGVAFDYVRRVRTHYGWIARGLDDRAADELLTAVESEGLVAVKKPEDRLPTLATTVTTRRAHLHEGACLVQSGTSGKLHALPWAGLSMVSIGSVPEVRQRAVRETNWGIDPGGSFIRGVPVLRAVKTTVYEQVSEEGVLIHLIYSGPGLVVEIRPKQFNYEYLGERLGGTSRENFVMLLADLRRLADASYWTRMSTAFVERGELQPEFQDEMDFFRFNQWISAKSSA